MMSYSMQIINFVYWKWLPGFLWPDKSWKGLTRSWSFWKRYKVFFFGSVWKGFAMDRFGQRYPKWSLNLQETLSWKILSFVFGFWIKNRRKVKSALLSWANLLPMTLVAINKLKSHSFLVIEIARHALVFVIYCCLVPLFGWALLINIMKFTFNDYDIWFFPQEKNINHYISKVICCC